MGVFSVKHYRRSAEQTVFLYQTDCFKTWCVSCLLSLISLAQTSLLTQKYLEPPFSFSTFRGHASVSLLHSTLRSLIIRREKATRNQKLSLKLRRIPIALNISVIRCDLPAHVCRSIRACGRPFSAWTRKYFSRKTATCSLHTCIVEQESDYVSLIVTASISVLWMFIKKAFAWEISKNFIFRVWTW